MTDRDDAQVEADRTYDPQPAGGNPAQRRRKRPDRWLTGGVAGIAGASFLSDAGHEIPTSLMPALLTSTLARRRRCWG